MVEVVVASLVLGMAVIAVVTMHRNAQTMEATSDLRRQARLIAHEALEDVRYHYSPPPRYDGMAGYAQINQMNIGLPNEMNCSLSVSAPLRVTTLAGKALGYRRVEAKVAWNFEGVRDSVVLSKRVARLR